MMIYTGTNLTFNDPTLRPWGSAADYYVVASNFGSVGPSSNTVTLTTIPATSTIAPTSSPTANGNYFVVTCPTTSGADWVNIYRYDLVAGGIWPLGYPQVASHVAAGTGWTDPTLITHTTSRRYWCTSGNEGGESAWGPLADASGAPIVLAAPSAPTITSMWGRTVYFSWPAVPGAVAYQLRVGNGTSAYSTEGAGTTGSVDLPPSWGLSFTATAKAVSAYGRYSDPSAVTSVLLPYDRFSATTTVVLYPGAGQYDSRRTTSLVSANGLYVATFEGDGNFVIRHSTKAPTYQTDTNAPAPPGTSLRLQSDTNFVLYSGGAWQRQSQTSGEAVDKVVLQDDGNLVARNAANVPLWHALQKVVGGTPAQTFFR